MSASARSPLARPLFDMSDDDYGIPFQMPGNSSSFFDLDADVGLGYPTRRADNIKVQTIPGLPAPDADMTGSNRSMAEYLQRHRSGLADALANDQTDAPQNFSGNDRLQLADAPEATDEEFTGQDDDPDAIQIAEAKGRKSPRQPAQPAARPGQPATPPAPKPATPVPQTGLPNGNPDTYFDLVDKRVDELAKRLGVNRDALHSVFSLESGWMGKNEQARNNPFGYKRTHKDGTQSHIEFESLDEAFRVWENRWGGRVRGAQTAEEVVDKLQNPPPGAKNPYKYNSVDKDCREAIIGQYNTVLRRRENWMRRNGEQ